MVRKARILHYFGKRQKTTEPVIFPIVQQLIVVLTLFLIALSMKAKASETGVVYRAKRGPDSYFKSVEYKKTVLVSFVDQWAEHFDLPIHVIKGQVEQESGWDNNVVSHKGARGLMQIMPSTAYCHSPFCLRLSKDESLHNPYTNIYYGCKYMRMLLDYYDQDLELALMAYYGGLGRVNKIVDQSLGSERLELEIRNYADEVMEKSIKYKEVEDLTNEIMDNIQPVTTTP